MALFGKKDKKEEAKDKKETPEKKSSGETRAPKKETTKKPISKITKDTTHVLLHPRITEKGAVIAGDNAYTFDIDPRSTKQDVFLAIQKQYNVTPKKVNVLKVPAKQVFSRGRRGRKSGGKKAVVYLKKGDTIEFI